LFLKFRSTNHLSEELMNKIEKVEEQQNLLLEMNKALFERLDEQQKYIEERARQASVNGIIKRIARNQKVVTGSNGAAAEKTSKRNIEFFSKN
jgi:ribosomal protein L21